MTARYEHARYENRRRILRWLIHNVGYRVLAKFDGAEHTERLPADGPAIVIFNHIAFIDPIVVLSCMPRNVVPMARHDVFKIPGWGIFPRLWDVIPVRRGEVDRAALRKALSVLEAGEVVLVAPAGCDRRNGRLPGAADRALQQTWRNRSHGRAVSLQSCQWAS
jgi:1-acyl-sn-glycerol-3-phosphate acyltransferase